MVSNYTLARLDQSLRNHNINYNIIIYGGSAIIIKFSTTMVYTILFAGQNDADNITFSVTMFG